jgi:hypothetical protein
MFRTGHLNIEDEQRFGRSTHVTVPENVGHSFLDPGRSKTIRYKDRREPSDIQRKSRLCYSPGFRQEKVLSQLGSQMS